MYTRKKGEQVFGVNDKNGRFIGILVANNEDKAKEQLENLMRTTELNKGATIIKKLKT
jgi:hypothetical protein